MQRILPGLSVLLLAVLGAWGCAKVPDSPAGLTERVKALEAKNSRLEGDIRAAGSVRDQLRQQVAEAEATQTQLREEIARLQIIAQERDTLKKKSDDLTATLKIRTGERDAITAQFNQFRQVLRAQLDQMEPAATGQSMPQTPAGAVSIAPSALSGS